MCGESLGQEDEHTLQWILRSVLTVGGTAATVALGLVLGGNESSIGLVSTLTLMTLGFVLFHEYRCSVSYVLCGALEGLVVEAESIFGRRVHRLTRDEVWQIDVERDGRGSSWEHAALLIRGSRFQRRLSANFFRAQLRGRARELRAALGLSTRRARPSGAPDLSEGLRMRA